MNERWARPAKVLDIEEEPTMVIEGSDGRVWGVPRITVDEDTSERIRLGYMCMACFQPFPAPWPELCGFCGFRVREEQGGAFERMYQGVERLKPGFDGEENLDIYDLLTREMRRH